MAQYAFYFRRHSLHRLQDLRDGLQGLQGPFDLGVAYRKVYEVTSGETRAADANGVLHLPRCT